MQQYRRFILLKPHLRTYSQLPKSNMTQNGKPSWKAGDYADKDGQFRRPDSVFRSSVSSDPASEFPAESGRYALYVNFGCPWAHRTIITRGLKGLQDIIQLIEVDGMTEGKGWTFTGETGPEKDPLYGGKYLRDLYERVVPNYEGKVTVPVLWDKKKETIVNNESSEIIRMFYDSFDALIPEEQREKTKGKAGLFPDHLRSDIEAMNDWVYNTINNGVYKTGFASTQDAYEGHLYAIFKSLDRLEEHLSDSAHQPYLFGSTVTEADIRLYTTMIRFDPAYNPIFKCNLKMIRYDYPRLHNWLRNLYWKGPEIFHKSVKFEAYKTGYSRAVGAKVYPVGPLPNIMPL